MNSIEFVMIPVGTSCHLVVDKDRTGPGQCFCDCDLSMESPNLQPLDL